MFDEIKAVPNGLDFYVFGGEAVPVILLAPPLGELAAKLTERAVPPWLPQMRELAGGLSARLREGKGLEW